MEDMNLIRRSGLFRDDWYLANNPDLIGLKVNPLFHYLNRGGFERRDPSPDFSSGWYLSTYPDAKRSKLNPLIHFLRFGRKNGYKARPEAVDFQNYSYLCPLCENKVEAFLPIVPYYEENRKKHGYPYSFDDLETLNNRQYTCPFCGALDRDRLYALYLKHFLMEQPSKQISLLDIAPSRPLRRFLWKYSNINYKSMDLYMNGVDIVGDITDMNTIPDSQFDFFICSHVLEHVPDDQKALSELYRVLKPQGHGILMVPIILKAERIDEDPGVTDESERWRRFGQNDHVRLYSKKGFVERITRAGFTLYQYGSAHFGEDVFALHGITSKSVLYIGTKS